MPGRNFLFIPGPTNVPRRIQNAMSVEQEDMRAMDLPDFTKPLYEDLKKIFKTKNGRIFIFPASGTGGWEIRWSHSSVCWQLHHPGAAHTRKVRLVPLLFL